MISDKTIISLLLIKVQISVKVVFKIKPCILPESISLNLFVIQNESDELLTAGPTSETVELLSHCRKLKSFREYFFYIVKVQSGFSV